MIEKLQQSFPAPSSEKSLTKQQTSSAAGQSSFAQTFEQALKATNDAHVQADQKIERLVTGQDKDIHGTMIALEKADVSTRLLLGVRNKMVSAYQEVMRMQI